LRLPFQHEQAALAEQSHRFLRRYNRSVHTRLSGYLEIGRRCQFQYPWPVVAMLGICQVLTGIGKNRLYGLLGPTARRLGVRLLEQMVENTEDVLRRTNRGIFADSLPTVMLALRVHELRERGEHALADVLLDGPLPLLMDRESHGLARSLAGGLAIHNGAQRFATLSELTLEHFAREQAIFTYHMGSPGTREPALVKRMSSVRAVPAPVVVRTVLGGRRLVFKPFAMPAGFDMRDHETRVREFGRAYVNSVTRDLDDYRCAAQFIAARFGKPGERLTIAFADR